MKPTKPVLRRSRAQWRSMIRAQATSGVSIPEYCREHGLNVKSFYAWRKRLGGIPAPAKPSEFIQIETQDDNQPSCLTIQTPNGYHLRIPEGVSETQVKTILSITASAQ